MQNEIMTINNEWSDYKMFIQSAAVLDTLPVIQSRKIIKLMVEMCFPEQLSENIRALDNGLRSIVERYGNDNRKAVQNRVERARKNYKEFSATLAAAM